MRKFDERGETLVEVVMALAILSLVLVSSYTLATGTFRLGRGAGERTQAVNYLQQQIEALRAYRNEVAWVDFSFAMNGYIHKNFCMKQSEVLSKKVWRPTETDCSFDGITVAIEPSTVVTKNLNDQYNYKVTGTWKTGLQENNVSLTTKLVNQE